MKKKNLQFLSLKIKLIWIFSYVLTQSSSFSFSVYTYFCNGIHYPIVFNSILCTLEITPVLYEKYDIYKFEFIEDTAFDWPMPLIFFFLLNSEYYSFDRKETLKTWAPPPRLCGWRESPHPRAFVFLHEPPGSRQSPAKASIHRITNRNSPETLFLWLFIYIYIFLTHRYFGSKKQSMHVHHVGISKILFSINVFFYHYTFWNNNSMISALTWVQLIWWQSCIHFHKTLMWKTLWIKEIKKMLLRSDLAFLIL